MAVMHPLPPVWPRQLSHQLPVHAVPGQEAVPAYVTTLVLIPSPQHSSTPDTTAVQLCYQTLHRSTSASSCFTGRRRRRHQLCPNCAPTAADVGCGRLFIVLGCLSTVKVIRACDRPRRRVVLTVWQSFCRGGSWAPARSYHWSHFELVSRDICL